MDDRQNEYRKRSLPNELRGKSPDHHVENAFFPPNSALHQPPKASLRQKKVVFRTPTTPRRPKTPLPTSMLSAPPSTASPSQKQTPRANGTHSPRAFFSGPRETDHPGSITVTDETPPAPKPSAFRHVGQRHRGRLYAFYSWVFVALLARFHGIYWLHETRIL